MHTIIITTDFSGTAINAAKYATGLAQDLGVSKIVLYHSYDYTPAPTEIPVTETNAALAHEGSLLALEIVEREVRSVLEQDDDITIELIANDIPLEHGIELLVEQWQAGLVVVGTSGKSGLQKFFTGSNTRSLASTCPAPLLIIPGESVYTSIEKVVFACDLQQVSQTTPVSEIAWWLEKLQAELLVLHVSKEGKSFNPDTILEQYKMHSLLDTFNPKYAYEEGDDVAEEIADFAEDEHAGIVITIPKTYGFFESLFKRSVSKQLTEKTEVPLLLLKDRHIKQ